MINKFWELRGIMFSRKFFHDTVDFIEKHYYIFLILILTMGAFNLFFNLGNNPIYSWDEARHGVNAYEMLKAKNFIVNTYKYENDYWNLKPPVSYIAIILGYKLLGFNALGLRFFSALVSLLTILIVAVFSLHKYGRFAALVSSAALATSVPFILEHCGRTGDADALFVLFFTASIISMALADENIRWFYSSGFFFALAFLTKSWHAGNIVVIAASYMFMSRLIFKLRKKDFVIFLISSLSPIILWGILRYRQDGFKFLYTMIQYDLVSRTSTTLEGHVGGSTFYIDKLFISYTYWMIVMIVSIISLMLLEKKNILSQRNKRHVLILVLWIVVPLALYTKAKTKIWWYILPLYPALAVSIGALTSAIIKNKNRNAFFMPLIIIAVMFSIYKNEAYILREVSKINVNNVQEAIKKIKDFPEYRGKTIYINSFEQSLFLCAELYGDLIPKDGDFQDFIKDSAEDSLMLIEKNKRTIFEGEDYKIKIITENEEACIITKKY